MKALAQESPVVVEAPGVSAEPVFRALAMSNRGSFPLLARQFIRRWGRALGAQVEIEGWDEVQMLFVTTFSGFYLRGFEEARCVLLPPWFDVSAHRKAVLLQKWCPSGEPALVVCPCEQMRNGISAALSGRVVALALGDISAARDRQTDANREALRRVIRTQMPLLRLQPYDTTRPVAGEMFFGRQQEQELLLHQQRDSFLLTGPSRIGKTSSLHHYHWSLRKEGDPRLARSFYVNLQPCLNWGADDVARFFAMSFRDVPYTQGELSFRELRSFLYSIVSSSGGPVEIILDEADAVCGTDLLLTVAEFAASSRSRLIVIGRGAVRRFWRRHQATSFGRLRDMRFQALQPDAAWQLFARPIAALGLRIESEETAREIVLRVTSRMPHLVQGFARSVVELAARIGTATITPAMLQRPHDSFFDFGLLRGHLDDLQSPLATLAAVEVLTGFRQGLYTAERIHAALRGHGFKLNTSEIADLCDDLVTNCVLTWSTAGYGPPRWDIAETAQRHPRFLEDIRQECLEQLRPAS